MTTRTDWAKLVFEQARTSPMLRTDVLAERLGTSERLVWRALNRQVKRGLVEHFGKKIFLNRLARDFSGRELVSLIRPSSYVSLETALREWGISSQSPIRITSVTTGQAAEFKSESVQLSYRHISPSLFWGFQKKRTRYGEYNIAEPEKALLDWIYLHRKQGIAVATDELILDKLQVEKLLSYSDKYPKPVRTQLLELLATRQKSSPQAV